MLSVKTNIITLDSLLVIILVVKILWTISIFSQFVIKLYYPEYVNLNTNIELALHNTFTFFIGILLVYLYNHLTPKRVCIEGHPKLYLYGFGILSILGSLEKAFHKYYFREYDKIESYL